MKYWSGYWIHTDIDNNRTVLPFSMLQNIFFLGVFFMQLKVTAIITSERAQRASEFISELRDNPEYERPWGRSSKANILGTGHPIDKRSSLLNVTWT